MLQPSFKFNFDSTSWSFRISRQLITRSLESRRYFNLPTALRTNLIMWHGSRRKYIDVCRRWMFNIRFEWWRSDANNCLHRFAHRVLFSLSSCRLGSRRWEFSSGRSGILAWESELSQPMAAHRCQLALQIRVQHFHVIYWGGILVMLGYSIAYWLQRSADRAWAFPSLAHSVRSWVTGPCERVNSFSNYLFIHFLNN